MSGKHVDMKVCPYWCTGRHDLINPDGECVHGSTPATLIVQGEPLEIRIESYVESGTEEPPPGLITGSFNGAAMPSMTADEATAFVAILGSLIKQIGDADQAS